MSQTLTASSLVSSSLLSSHPLIMLIQFLWTLSSKGCNATKTILAGDALLCFPQMPLSPTTSAALDSSSNKKLFKLASETYKTHNTCTTACAINSLLPYYTRCLRSSGTGPLSDQRCRTVGSSTPLPPPKEWNRLPISLRSSDSFPSFLQKSA